jgi:hypothetical protein
LGLVVHFFDYTQPFGGMFLSPYFICLLFLVLVWSVGAELYVLREGGHSLAKQLKSTTIGF